MKKILKYLLFALLAFLLVWVLWFLYQKSVTKPDEFTVEKPKKATIIKKTVANGSIVPRKEILIKPVVSGIVRELYVEAGDQVKKGDALARIQIVPGPGFGSNPCLMAFSTRVCSIIGGMG